MNTTSYFPFEFLPPTHVERPYSISEINDGVKALLESNNTLVWVEGEVSNWRHSANGHHYFRLKDAGSQIPAVMWRSTALQQTFEPEDGMVVMAIASLRVYKRGGYYQLNVHRMQPAGRGAFFASFEQLKNKLEHEGLFDQACKKELPATVRRIGVITSKRGAAVRDIVKVVSTRAPQTDIVIMDVSVQGDYAPKEITSAIEDFNEYGAVDCLIIGRGGGSIEDLWAFNTEIVARAVFESELPIISAVGHEIDFTITDFVADIRAPTPSTAAEIAVSDSKEDRRYFSTCSQRFIHAFFRCYTDGCRKYSMLPVRQTLRRVMNYLLDSEQQLEVLRRHYSRTIYRTLETMSSQVASFGSRLNSLSPLTTLSRGYSVVTKTDGAVVRESKQVNEGDEVHIRFHRGSARAHIKTTDENDHSV